MARENHQLHLDSIKVKDGMELKMEESKRKIKDLEVKLTEMKFLTDAKEKQLRTVEKEKEKLKAAFEATADPAARPRGLKGHMQMSSSLPPPVVPVRAGRVSAEDQELMDQMKSQARVDAQLIEALRGQLDGANNALRTAQEEGQRLALGLAATEAELAKSVKGTGQERAQGDAGASLLQQLQAADVGNKRVIDQLNGHVDFLNEQLALREAQLVEASSQIMRAENVQTELVAKSRLLDQLKQDNSTLIGQLKVAEGRLAVEVKRGPTSGSRRGGDAASVAASAMTGASVGSGWKGTKGQGRGGASPSPVSPSRRRGGGGDSGRDSGRGSGGGSVGSSMGNNSEADPVDLDTDEEDLDLSGNAGSPDENRRNQSQGQGQGLAGRGRGSPGKARKGANSSSHSSMPTIRVNVPSPTPSSHSLSHSPSPSHAESRHTTQPDALLSKLSAEKADLAEEVTRLQASEESLRERIKRADDKIGEIKSELSESKRTAEQLARKFKAKDSELARTILEHADAKKALQRSVAELQSRLSQADEWGDKTTAKEDALAAALAERNTLQAQVDDLTSELYALRRERGEVSQSGFEASQKASKLDKELAKVNAGADKATADLLTARTDLAALIIRYDDCRAALGERDARLAALQRVADERADEAATKGAALSEATRELLALRGAGAGVSGALDQLKADMQALREKITQHDGEKRAWLAEQRELVRRAETASVQSQLIKEVTSTEQQQRADLQARLRSAEEGLVDRDRELLVLRQQLAGLSGREAQAGDVTAHLSVTNEELRAQLRQRSDAVETLTSDLRLLQRRLGDVQAAYEEEQEQHRDAAVAALAKGDRLQRVERELGGLNDQLQACVGDKDRLEEHCQRLQRQAEAVARRAGGEREEVRRLMADKEAVEGRAEELRLLVGSMEGSARGQAAKIARLAAQLEETQATAALLEGDAERLREQLAVQERATSEHADALRAVDADRDRLQGMLDGEQEAAARRDAQRSAQANETAQLRQLLDRAEKRTAGATGELHATQRQSAALEARLASLKEENLELKRRVGMKNKEAGGATEDLMLMTKENQALTYELAEIASERDRLQRRVLEVAQLLAAREQSKKGVEMEKADLLDAYRAVLQDKRKLEEDVGALRAQKERVGVSALHLQDQLAEMQGAQAAKGGEASRLQGERQTLLRQLEKVNEEAARGARRMEAMEADNRRLMQEVHGLRSTNAMLNERVQAVIKRAGEAGEANKLLSTKLQQVERERDVVRAAVAVERQRSAEMERVAETARAQSAASGAQLSRMKLTVVAGPATTPASAYATAPASVSASVPASVPVPVSAPAPAFTPVATPATAAPAPVRAASPKATPASAPVTATRTAAVVTTPATPASSASSHRVNEDMGQGEGEDMGTDMDTDMGTDMGAGDDSDVEITRGSDGMSPVRHHSHQSHHSQSHSNDASHSHSHGTSSSADTSDVLLGLSEDDSLYFTEG